MSRTVRWQALLVGLGMALAGILLTYLALTYTTTQIPTVGGTYIEGVAGAPHYINPLLGHHSDTDRDLCALIFGGLTHLNSAGEVEPELASSWEISLDGLTYVFHLRTDVLWHDGTPFTADDVLATVRLLQAPDYPGPRDLGRLWQTVQVVKVDDYTVNFVLVEPYAPFIDYTTIGLLPAHLMENVLASELLELEFNLSPVGTGPFQVAEVEIENGNITSVLLQRNPEYYKSGPMLEHLRFRFYTSNAAAFRAYEDGEVDGVREIDIDLLARAEANDRLQLYAAQTAQYAAIFFNLGQEDELAFFQDNRVRQALLYGLDRERMIEEVLHGRGIVAHSPIVAGTWAYDEQIPHYSYDPELAIQLLEESGWRMPPGAFARNRSGSTFVFSLLASADPVHTALANDVARQWSEIGLQVTVVTTSPVGVRQALEQGNYEAALVELAWPGDPDPYPLWHQTQISIGQNYAGLNHRRISEIIETARIVLNREHRFDLYRDFQALFAEQVPAIMLYHPIYTYGVDRKIQGVQIGPMMQSSDRFAVVNEWYLATRRMIVSQAESR